MRKLILIFTLCLAAVSFAAAQNPGLIGTWKCVKTSEAITLPYGYYSIKLITDNHFMAVIVDKQGNILQGSGGRYTFDGRTYVESLDYILPSHKRFYKDTPSYTVTIEGNRFFLKGKLGNLEIDEIWEKIE